MKTVNRLIGIGIILLIGFILTNPKFWETVGSFVTGMAFLCIIGGPLAIIPILMIAYGLLMLVVALIKVITTGEW